MGPGRGGAALPVILKVKEKDGKEKELDRTMVKIDPTGKSVALRLTHQPKEVGRKLYIVEVETPKEEKGDKALNPSGLRLERTIEVIDAKLMKVLIVEGQPRYEFRYFPGVCGNTFTTER